MINRICKKIRQMSGGMREYDILSPLLCSLVFYLTDISDKSVTFWIGFYLLLIKTLGRPSYKNIWRQQITTLREM